ncbi:MAG: hypothetical protein K2Y12_11175 [Chitinophagaceae bacterium]|jgi:hypothetical protein|nr:hypothetical protein [Chitinophagaceae bacterium]
MRVFVHIDDAAYLAMLGHIERSAQTDTAGLQSDISFYNEDFWLQDSAVIENIEYRNGEWNVFLVFAHQAKLLKLIKRKIKNYSCPKKAQLTAYYMRKLAAKDQRGTIIVKTDNLTINFS